MTDHPFISEEAALSRIGEAIRKQRKLMGLTQLQFAGNAGISPSYLSQIENGRKTLSILMFFRICSSNNISPSELLKCLEPEKSVYDLVVDSIPELDEREIDKIIDFLSSVRSIPRD